MPPLSCEARVSGQLKPRLWQSYYYSHRVTTTVPSVALQGFGIIGWMLIFKTASLQPHNSSSSIVRPTRQPPVPCALLYTLCFVTSRHVFVSLLSDSSSPPKSLPHTRMYPLISMPSKLLKCIPVPQTRDFLRPILHAFGPSYFSDSEPLATVDMLLLCVIPVS